MKRPHIEGMNHSAGANSIQNIADLRVRTTLEKLHAASDRDMPRIALGFVRSLGRGLEPHHMRDAYIAIERGQGRWLHDLVLERRAQNIVEFGASFGISSIWLGAAAREIDGRVVTTEIEPNKISGARDNIRQAGLDNVVTLLAGDALDTLRDHRGPIDLLFFDGWPKLYPPLLEMLEPRLASDAALVVDNANFPSAARFVRSLRGRPGWTLGEGPDARTAIATWSTR